MSVIDTITRVVLAELLKLVCKRLFTHHKLSVRGLRVLISMTSPWSSQL